MFLVLSLNENTRQGSGCTIETVALRTAIRKKRRALVDRNTRTAPVDCAEHDGGSSLLALESAARS